MSKIEESKLGTGIIISRESGEKLFLSEQEMYEIFQYQRRLFWKEDAENYLESCAEKEGTQFLENEKFVNFMTDRIDYLVVEKNFHLEEVIPQAFEETKEYFRTHKEDDLHKEDAVLEENIVTEDDAKIEQKKKEQSIFAPKYLLISTVERTSNTEFFETLEEAQAQMLKEFLESTNDDIKEKEDDGDCAFHENDAWVSDGNNHDNYDWQIIEIPEELEKIKE